MYDTALLLASIDANRWPVMLGFGIAMIFQCWWLGNAVIVAKRDRSYSIPIFCTVYWFAHDLSVVMRFERWFFEYDHWYLKLFWFGLLLALVLEVLFLLQVLKYGRKELMPAGTKRQFTVILAMTLVAGVVIHEFFKGFFGDPLYQLDPTLTMMIYPLFSAAMLIRRGSSLGQSLTMWWTFSAMTLMFHLTTFLHFGQQFGTPAYLLSGIFAALMGAALASKRLRDALHGSAGVTKKVLVGS